MKKEELEQLINLRREISNLEVAIIKIKQQRAEIVTDKVRASSRDFPYIDGFAKVSGINAAAELRKDQLLFKKESLLAERKKKAEEAEIKIIEYINSVQDSRIRSIMQYRYIDGYTWNKIAKSMHCDRTYPEKLVSKYLKE
ncbi:MAG: hypothetical protein K2G55_06465 [Lachnospiraceae bacterium]|nr:hypothetical protein [Lachnospiraceae bacterium]